MVNKLTLQGQKYVRFLGPEKRQQPLGPRSVISLSRSQFSARLVCCWQNHRLCWTLFQTSHKLMYFPREGYAVEKEYTLWVKRPFLSEFLKRKGSVITYFSSATFCLLSFFILIHFYLFLEREESRGREIDISMRETEKHKH